MFATTKQFLDDLGLTSLEQLPALQQLAKDGGSDSALLEMRALEASLQASMEPAPEASADAFGTENKPDPDVPDVAVQPAIKELPAQNADEQGEADLPVTVDSEFVASSKHEALSHDPAPDETKDAAPGHQSNQESNDDTTKL